MTHPQGHLDLDALADVLAGERDDAHLRSCDRCADRFAELAAADAQVSAALAALPAPPLPAGLSLRLTQAVQAERRQEVASVRTQRRGRPPSWLPAVAASAVLVTAGATGWALLDLSGDSGQDTAASTAAGGGSGQDRTSEESGGADDAADGGGDEAASDVAAPDAAAGSGTSPGAASPTAATAFAAPTAATATDWAVEASRPAALARLLGLSDERDASTADDPAPVAPAVSGLDRLRDPAALSACLAGLPGEEVLAVDYASYDGVPALAVVQPDGAARVRVTVVASGCSAADPQVLQTTVVERP